MAINTLQSERLGEGPPGFFTLCTRLKSRRAPGENLCVWDAEDELSAESSSSSTPAAAVVSLLSVSDTENSHTSIAALRQSQTTHVSSVYCFLLLTHLPPLPASNKTHSK